MLNKKILAAAIAATFTHSAFAVVDLDASPVVPAVFASETVAASTTTTDGAREILGTGNVLDVDAAVGFGFTQNTSFWVRYELTGAVFETALTAGELALGGTATEVVTLSQGGAEDDNVVIFEVVDTAAAVGLAQVLTLTLADLGLTGTGSTSITMTVHASSPDAVNNANALVTKSGAHVTQASALTTTFTPAAAVEHAALLRAPPPPSPDYLQAGK